MKDFFKRIKTCIWEHRYKIKVKKSIRSYEEVLKCRDSIHADLLELKLKGQKTEKQEALYNLIMWVLGE